MKSCFNVRKQKQTKEAERKRLFMENNRLLLEELVASCDGKCNPIRSFSAEELKQATNNYDSQQVIAESYQYVLYKGVLQDRPVSIKRYKGYEDWGARLVEPAINDIVIGSQMSAHNNVLKLLGCCLDTIHLTIVYEFVGDKTLYNAIVDTNGKRSPLLSWKHRIKIAMGIANGVSYVHTALLRPVIHRNIKPATVTMDREFNAKLFDFSVSIAIPEGQSHVVDDVRGSMGYLAPEFFYSHNATEKVDVYAFGVVLIQLLTGREVIKLSHRPDETLYVKDIFVLCMENGELIKIVDASILDEGVGLQDLLPFATLALSCVCGEAENRPTMIRVAKELKRIYQSVPVSFQTS